MVYILINTVKKEFHYYPFSVKLDRCAGSCNTINDLSNKVYVPNKTEVLNLSMWIMVCEKHYVWNPATCNCKNGKYLASIMHDSGINCDEVIE